MAIYACKGQNCTLVALAYKPCGDCKHFRPKTNWISVDTPPEKEDSYLVYPRKYHTTAVYNIHGEWAGKWTSSDENGYDYEVIITHWQPLPEPPEVK
jgi:hypothetical protein